MGGGGVLVCAGQGGLNFEVMFHPGKKKKANFFACFSQRMATKELTGGGKPGNQKGEFDSVRMKCTSNYCELAFSKNTTFWSKAEMTSISGYVLNVRILVKSGCVHSFRSDREN